MCYRFMRTGSILVTSMLALGPMVGCGGGTTLPATIVVELPDGTAVEVDQGAGVPSLANSTWSFFQTVGETEGGVFLVISFGETGNLEKFDNNTIAPEIFGDTILFDGAKHATAVASVSYEASTFGAETADNTGFAFEGRMTLFALGIQAGSGTADAMGEFDPNDPNTMTGSFTISTRVTLLDIPEANTDQVITFVARRTQ